MPEEEEKSGQPGDLTPGVFVYLCVGVFEYMCICVFGIWSMWAGGGEEVWPGDLTPVYLCICIFVYFVFGRSGARGGGEVRPAR